MSYIVPREKPKACRNCGFLDKVVYDCKLMWDKDYEDYDIQYANCPLIEIPTPHGKLIDADEFYLAIIDKGQKNERGKYHLGEFWELNGREIREVIDEQPPVIEAEMDTK